MDKLRMKFSALNVDFDGPNLDFLGSRKLARESIKERYPRKSRDEMAGDDWQFANRNCYRLSRVPWALAQISCSFKRWNLVATILIIFPKINRPIWQILCSFNTCAYVLSGELGEGWAPPACLDYTTGVVRPYVPLAYRKTSVRLTVAEKAIISRQPCLHVRRERQIPQILRSGVEV